MRKVSSTFWAFVVIALSVVYQIHCAIHGLDLTDEGYLMSIYQWFGTDVDFAKGAGGYPLTCYLGGLLHSWTPGILPMRLWGIFVVTLTVILVYLYLKDIIPTRYILFGLLIQTIIVAGDPKPFGYNTLTAFVSVLAIVMILEGSFRKSYLLLSLGGFLLAVHVFIRIPNVIGVSYTFLPYCYCALKKSSWVTGRGFIQSSMVLFGMVASIVMLWFLFPLGIKAQLTEFLQSITSQLDGSSSHGTSNMLLSILKNYGECILYLFLFAVSVFLSAWAHKSRYIFFKVMVFGFSFMILYWPVYLRTDVLGHKMFALVNAIALAGSVFLLFFSKDARFRLIVLAGIMFALICPLGSDRGFVTMWTGTYLALPMGLFGLYSMLSQPFWQNNHRSIPAIPRQPLMIAYCFSMFTLLTIVACKVEMKAYYDPGFKCQKYSPIQHSSLANGIMTDTHKANVVSQVIQVIRQHSNKGDDILVYESSPLLYYLTETRPWAGISWPCVFLGKRYVTAFNAAVSAVQHPPLVVLQHFNSSGQWSDVTPDEFATLDNNNPECNLMNQCVESFVKANGYHVIWTNGFYTVLKSDRNRLLVTNG